MRFSVKLLAFLPLASPYFVSAFSFSSSTPTSCDNVTVHWTGGKPPFQVLLTPLFDIPRNISIPSSAFDGSKGSFSTVVPFVAGKKFVLTMSDADGFGTGGTSLLLETGKSVGGTCDTTTPPLKFGFSLNSALAQCRPYTFSDYDNAVQPVTITGLIPGGQSFTLNPPVGPAFFTWTPNIAHGTSLIFFMVDSQGNQGGGSDILLVGTTDDNTCLNSTSPSSTAAPIPSSTSPTESGGSVGSTPSQTTAAPGDSVSVAAIVGAIIGVLILTAATISLALFYIRKRRRSSGNLRADRHNSLRINSNFNLNESSADLPNINMRPQTGDRQDLGPASASHLLPPGQYEPDPFTLPPPSHTTASRYSSFSRREDSEAGTSDQMTSAQRKAAMAGVSAYKPARFILHTDVEEAEPPGDDELIELPPQYSASRAPLRSLTPILQGQSSAASSSSNPPYPHPNPPPNRYP